MKKAKYFTEKEFRACTPSCSINDMHQGTLKRLDLMRENAGIPLVLTSAYRSPAHDKSKERSGTGAHTTGRAVDIRCNTSSNRMKIVEAALKAGFRRIGIASTFVHVDDSPNHAQSIIWLY